MLLLDPSLPNIDSDRFDRPTGVRLSGASVSTHAPRFLLLYGSLRERAYSRLLTLEAARLLQAMGGEVRVFDPAGLPMPDAVPDSHPKVQELREAAAWCEGMVWTSPERHGAMTGLMKTGEPARHLTEVRVRDTSHHRRPGAGHVFSPWRSPPGRVFSTSWKEPGTMYPCARTTPEPA